MAGWTIGTGVETRLGASNWSVKLEYLYLNLGRHTVNPQCASTSDNNGARPFCDGPPSSQALPVDSTFSDHVIRIGLNYNIGGTRTVAQPASPSTTVAANWTGFYAGGNFGYGVGHDGLDIQRFATDGTPTRTLFNLTQSPAGVIGGAQAGYRLQRGWLVIGAEADFQWSKQKDTSCINCTGAAINYDEKRDWFGTVRGVVGVAQNSWLWYVTGGFAYGRVAIDHNVPAGDFILARSHSTEIGWAAGAGVETKLGSSNWSARFEYLYMDLGTVSFDSICSANTAGLFGLQVGRCEALTNTITDHIFRVGLNYQFGSYSR